MAKHNKKIPLTPAERKARYMASLEADEAKKQEYLDKKAAYQKKWREKKSKASYTELANENTRLK